VLVRIYGTGVEDLYDRQSEISTFEFLGKRGLSSRLLAKFPEGRIEEWLFGFPLTVDQLRSEKVLLKIAKSVAALHRLPYGELLLPVEPLSPSRRALQVPNSRQTPIEKSPIDNTSEMLSINTEFHWENAVCLRKCREWISTVRQVFLENTTPTQPLYKGLSITDIEWLTTEIAKLPHRLFAAQVAVGCSGPTPCVGCGVDVLHGRCATSSVEAPLTICHKCMTSNPALQVSFCHNDIQENNILMIDNECQSLRLIDFEFAGFNFSGFDIASCFLECTYDYMYESHPFYSYEPWRYPSLDSRRRFASAYLDAKQDSCSSDILLVAVERLVLAGHLFWGLWGIIRGPTSVAVDEFDYQRYAKERFAAYRIQLDRIGLADT